MSLLAVFEIIICYYIIYFVRLTIKYENLFSDTFFFVSMGVFYGWGLLIVFTTAIAYLFKIIKPLNERMDRIILNKQKQSKIARDLGRKLCHFTFLVIIYYAGYFTARLTVETLPHLAYDINRTIWGITPEFRVDPANWYWEMPTMQTIQVLVFFVSHVIAWYVDLLRGSKKFWFIGRNTVIRFLKEKEINDIGSYSPFLTGITATAFILPPFPVFAIAWVMIVADTMASQIGMRWGTHRFSWNGKSWEGTIAGVVGALGVIIFVGPLWAIITAAVYLIIDLITEKPIPITDNLAFPLFLTIIYLVLGESGILYSVLPSLL